MSFIAKVAAVRAAMGLPADMPLPTVIDIELETYGGDDVTTTSARGYSSRRLRSE